MSTYPEERRAFAKDASSRIERARTGAARPWCLASTGSHYFNALHSVKNMRRRRRRRRNTIDLSESFAKVHGAS